MSVRWFLECGFKPKRDYLQGIALKVLFNYPITTVYMFFKKTITNVKYSLIVALYFHNYLVLWMHN